MKNRVYEAALDVAGSYQLPLKDSNHVLTAGPRMMSEQKLS